jgi:hypothetical protein
MNDFGAGSMDHDGPRPGDGMLGQWPACRTSIKPVIVADHCDCWPITG